jgi:DNA topoisomerase-2
VSGLSKSRPKSAKAFDFDDDSPDDTNYELLAKSSPHKTATKDDHIDSFLSDDEPFVAPSKSAATKSKPTSTDSEDPTPAGLATVKKGRGRPAGAKSKEPAKPKAAPKATKTAASKVASRPATKQTTLSPAAKAYAAKKAVKKSVLDDDSDEDMADPDSPPPKVSSRVRPGRAAASRRPIVVDDDSSVMQQDDESDDPFEVDDDED